MKLSSRVVVGIDLSLRATGVVAYRVRSRRVAGNLLLATKLDRDAEFDLQRRIDYICTGIEVFVGDWDDPLVAIENAAFGVRHSNSRQHELAGAVKYMLWKHGVPFSLYSTTALKYTATGKGTADKDAMVAAANEAGFACTDHNLADAYWCARHAVEVARVMA